MVDSLSSSYAVQSVSDGMEAFSTPVQETWRLGFRLRATEALEFSGLVYRQYRFDRHTDGLLVGVTHRIRGNVATHIQAQYRQQKWSFGGGSAIASSSLVTEWLKGKTLDQASEIKNSAIAEELALPPVKIHCSVLAEDAIKAAVADLKSKQK